MKPAIAVRLKHRAFGIGVVDVTGVLDGFKTGEFEAARGIRFRVRQTMKFSLVKSGAA